jgi:hypothetical protein
MGMLIGAAICISFFSLKARLSGTVGSSGTDCPNCLAITRQGTSWARSARI